MLPNSQTPLNNPDRTDEKLKIGQYYSFRWCNSLSWWKKRTGPHNRDVRFSSNRIRMPVNKPQSSPRLLMPDDRQQQDIPIINAPQGNDDMVDGPQLSIVPATPVSGGGADSARVPFQPMSTHSQGKSLDFFSDRRLLMHFFRSWIKRPTVSERFSPIQVHQNNAVASSSRPTPNNDCTNLSDSSGFIFPIDPSQQQQQQHPRSRTYSDT